MRDDLNARAERRIAVLDPVKLVSTTIRKGRARTASRRTIRRSPSSAGARCRSRASCGSSATITPSTPPKGYFRLDAGRRGAAALRLHRQVHGRREGRSRQRDRGALHLRPGYAQRHARRRCAQGEGQHPLAVGRARGAGGSAAVRPAVRGALSRARAIPGATSRRRRRARAGASHGRRGRRRRRHRRASSATISTISIPNPSASSRAFVEPALAAAAPEERFQFERHGYFVADLADHAPDAPVFNRSVSLKDSWAK